MFLGANVHATTATGDTALTYACENGHTDVADVLLQAGADLVRLLLHLVEKNLWFQTLCQSSCAYRADRGFKELTFLYGCKKR